MVINQKMISAALTRLNAQLPLKQRQQQLEPALNAAHKLVLRTLVEQGRPPTEAELTEVLGTGDIKADIQQLGSADLVVLDSTGSLPLGAYPVTIEPTPHRITVNGHAIYAMCALDAMSVAPMFATEVLIESSCHVSEAPIKILMHDSAVLDQQPGPEVSVGIRWQMPSAVAAHSMCLQMVFLRDLQAAVTWQEADLENISLFTLEEAIEFGKSFFLSLLD